MPENRQNHLGRPRDSLKWKIFIIYLISSLGMILGLNGILIINNNRLFGNQSFLFGIILIALTYILLAILFWFLIKKILSPLNELIHSLQVFLEGNWEQRIYLQNNDETGILAEQFNDILDELVDIYVTQDKVVADDEEISIPPQIPGMPILDKMDGAQDLDELLRVTIQEISQDFNADSARLVLLTNDPNSESSDFTQRIKGNGHEKNDPMA